MNRTIILWIGIALLTAAGSGAAVWLTNRLGADPDAERFIVSKTSHSRIPDADDPPIIGHLPDFTLTDQTGEVTDLDRLRGKVCVVDFIFTRCTTTCPAQTAAMSALAGDIEREPWKGLVQFVSLTVDPEHDTPEVLQDYAGTVGAGSKPWWFLTGHAEAVRALCSGGFKLPVEGAKGGPIVHTSKFALVDPIGRIRGIFDGLEPAGLSALKRTLKRVASETVVRPADSAAPAWLAGRRRAQLDAGKSYEVFHGFTFHDRARESGLRFRHRIVDDSGKTHKAVHYDHGTGLAVADVDGDSRLDLYFVNQAGPNGLFRNLGGGQFEDITAVAGVATAGGVGVTASFADLDNDGDPDLLVTRVRAGNRAFENLGGGRFRDVTESSGLGHKAHSSAALFFDYNRDGLLDLFLVNVGKYTTDEVAENSQFDRPAGSAPFPYYVGFKDAFSGHLKPERFEKSFLLKNMGGFKFLDASEEAGLHHADWSGDATSLDANGDGWPDLYVLSMQGHDHYYENMDGKSFVEKVGSVFAKTPWGSMGVKSFDYNNDGRFDLFVTDMHSDMSVDIDPGRESLKSEMRWAEDFMKTEGRSLFGNAFYENQGGGRFVECSDRLGVENYWPWGPSAGDLNADGFEDLFITASMNFPYRYGVNSLFLNDRGRRFLGAEFLLGVEPRRDERSATPWFERDCGEPSLGEAAPECDGRTGRTLVWGAVGSRASALADLDDDGDLDIVTNEFGSGPMLLLSNLSKAKPDLKYLKVNLVGTSSNRSGLGAIVTVTAGPLTLHRAHDGKSGYLSQSLTPLYFGLDTAAAVDRIRIRWPSGKTQDINGPIQPNTLLTIKEPG